MLKTFETPNGKIIQPYYSGSGIAMKFTTGGEIPEALSGLYTDMVNVERAVNLYLAKKEEKASKKD